MLHKSTKDNLYPLFIGDRDLYEKVRENMTVGHSLIFKQKAEDFDQFFVCKLSNTCKTLFGSDFSEWENESFYKKVQQKKF